MGGKLREAELRNEVNVKSDLEKDFEEALPKGAGAALRAERRLEAGASRELEPEKAF